MSTKKQWEVARDQVEKRVKEGYTGEQFKNDTDAILKRVRAGEDQEDVLNDYPYIKEDFELWKKAGRRKFWK